MKYTLSVIALVLTAACGFAQSKPAFTWKDVEGEHPILMYDGKHVLEYVRPTFDKSQTPPGKDLIANPTIKVFHHLYDAGFVLERFAIAHLPERDK